MESLEDMIKEIQSTKSVLSKKLIELKRELSVCESEYKKSRNKLKKIKEECEKSRSEPHAAQLYYSEPYQLKQLEIECSDAYQEVETKRKEVEEMEDKIQWIKGDIRTYKERLQTLQSNRSKFEEPVRLVERTHIPSNQQSAASSVASMGLANSQRSLNQQRSTDSLTQNAARSEQVPNSNIHAAVSDASSILPSLNTNPSSHPRPVTNISPTQRRNITLPSLQSNVAAIRPSVDSISTTVQSRPPRSARPSTGQARSAAPRCHRRRSSLTEPLNVISNDCPNCAQLRVDLQRSRQTILRLRLNSNANVN